MVVDDSENVSTHSHPKAAADFRDQFGHVQGVSTHSRPKAAARRSTNCGGRDPVSTHSRPKAAARLASRRPRPGGRFNTQPPEGGCMRLRSLLSYSTLFQHTAARRRLRHPGARLGKRFFVSTHSRPKAAARARALMPSKARSFNTQPPEGGCLRVASNVPCNKSFNTQPPEGGCD